MRLRTSFLALAFVLGLAPSASAAPKDHLWATINVCDTERKPDTIGIRARMPGDGTRRRMYMRFRTQFFSQEDFSWKYVRTGGMSPWVLAGSALFAFKETGYEFEFDAPAAGESYQLRGVVEFQWRRGSKVIKRKRKFTEEGHRSQGADPRGFSAARCRIEGPAQP